MIDLAFDLRRPRQDELGSAQQSIRENGFDSSKFRLGQPLADPWKIWSIFCPAAKLGKDLIASSFVDRGSAAVIMVMICCLGFGGLLESVDFSRRPDLRSSLVVC